MQVDDLQLNLSSQQVYLQQQPVEVTPKEFAILARLIMRAGQTVNRELLQQDLYTGRMTWAPTRWKCISTTCAVSWARIASAPCAASATVWNLRHDQHAPPPAADAGADPAGHAAHQRLLAVARKPGTNQLPGGRNLVRQSAQRARRYRDRRGHRVAAGAVADHDDRHAAGVILGHQLDHPPAQPIAAAAGKALCR